MGTYHCYETSAEMKEIAPKTAFGAELHSSIDSQQFKSDKERHYAKGERLLPVSILVTRHAWRNDNNVQNVYCQFELYRLQTIYLPFINK